MTQETKDTLKNEFNSFLFFGYKTSEGSLKCIMHGQIDDIVASLCCSMQKNSKVEFIILTAAKIFLEESLKNEEPCL